MLALVLFLVAIASIVGKTKFGALGFHEGL
jgi:hypothetical protein